MSAYARAFARHETFYPRYGWLGKAVRAAMQRDDAFVAEDATVKLGVGKNMVRAIRYWGLAFRLLNDPDDSHRSRTGALEPTDFGRFLLADKGMDPYLEESQSLWFLHWMLLRQPSMAPVWFLAFNRYPHREFSEPDLVDWLLGRLAAEGHGDIVRGSLEKDVSCLVRMYAPPSPRTAASLVSPFSALRMIDRIDADPKSTRYRITYGPKSGLPDELVTLVALDSIKRRGTETRSLGLATLATEESGPGRVFALSETEIAAAIEKVASRVSGLSLATHAGARVFAVATPIADLEGQLIRALYPHAKGTKLHLKLAEAA